MPCDFVFGEFGDSAILHVCLKKCAPSFFHSSKTLDDARRMCKRCKFLHFQEYKADVGLMKACAKNNCTLVISISDLIHLRGIERAKKIRRMRNFIKIGLHFGAKFKIATLAKNEIELRNRHEIKAVGMLLGFDDGQAKIMLERGCEDKGK